jgi:glyoxylase-like metal-dependent hydrolase (beta-lactamase superfamily II)
MIRTLGTDFGHFFLLEQDGEVTLIDAGLSGYRDTLEPALAEMGRSIDDVKAIVLTHADPDHVGLAGELQRAHGIPVYVHRADTSAPSRTGPSTPRDRPWPCSRC